MQTEKFASRHPHTRKKTGAALRTVETAALPKAVERAFRATAVLHPVWSEKPSQEMFQGASLALSPCPV